MKMIHSGILFSPKENEIMKFMSKHVELEKIILRLPRFRKTNFACFPKRGLISFVSLTWGTCELKETNNRPLVEGCI